MSQEGLEPLYAVRFTPSQRLFFVGPRSSVQVILSVHAMAMKRLDGEVAQGQVCTFHNTRLHGTVTIELLKGFDIAV